MAGVYKLDITETEADLKQRLRHAKTASDKERLQLLYLLKSGQAKTVQAAATLLARHRITVQKWLHLYRAGGLVAMLAHKPRTGRQQSIPPWAQEALTKRLQIPPNIILLFQPSHSPETNPIERVWQPFKLGLRWQLPKHLDELRLLMRARLEAMPQAVIASIVGWQSILQALSVAGI
ncbi:helix-turn-helix domain-containing protein [Stenomitos frigidus]|uniref:IS630 family transposase n=2 Tax=Stenomitos frigidus ULC18 TaxID=2107698 RepID=A0A2T1E8M8_9CYAN|nr:helix-turn-helix domain-containing protein [Stenomitos frigidus]PSB29097.1 hypothetical protein C7B82_12230 [Stenomitos frigidus ULC18]